MIVQVKLKDGREYNGRFLSINDGVWKPRRKAEPTLTIYFEHDGVYDRYANFPLRELKSIIDTEFLKELNGVDSK